MLIQGNKVDSLASILAPSISNIFSVGLCIGLMISNKFLLNSEMEGDP